MRVHADAAAVKEAKSAKDDVVFDDAVEALHQNAKWQPTLPLLLPVRSPLPIICFWVCLSASARVDALRFLFTPSASVRRTPGTTEARQVRAKERRGERTIGQGRDGGVGSEEGRGRQRDRPPPSSSPHLSQVKTHNREKRHDEINKRKTEGKEKVWRKGEHTCTGRKPNT